MYGDRKTIGAESSVCKSVLKPIRTYPKRKKNKSMKEEDKKKKETQKEGGDAKSARDLILDSLKEKSTAKQFIYRSTVEIFQEFKTVLKEIQMDLNGVMSKYDKSVEITFRDNGIFEAEIKFSGDLLIFTMHSNVFNFDPDHNIFKSNYVQENPIRSYCGMIQVYNFLADSFKYNRANDLGYLVARIFINKEKHYFVEGKRQLGFLYNDFENAVIDKKAIKDIVESTILYAMSFDLLVPQYDSMKEISVSQKLEQIANAFLKTGKRLGFRFQADNDVQ